MRISQELGYERPEVHPHNVGEPYKYVHRFNLHWDEEAREGLGAFAQPVDDGLQVSVTDGYRYTGFYKADERPWSLPHMQDRLLDKWDVGLSSITPAPPAEFPLDDPGSIGSSTLAVATGLDRIAMMNLSSVLASATSTASLPWVPPLFHESAKDLYKTLRAGPITKRVEISARDPLDKDFCIWYLLVDLIDLSRLALQIQGALKLLRKFRSKAKVKDVANAFLALEFGLKPTIADVRDFIAIIRKMVEHLSTTRDVIGGVYTCLAPKRVLRESSTPRTFYFTDSPGVSLQLDTQMTGIVELHQTTKFYFVSPAVADMLSYFKLSVDRLGLLDPTVLWDIIPWSFVVDWVADVSGWVHKNLKPQLMPCDLIVCDWGESLHHAVDLTGVITYPSYRSYISRDPVTKTATFTGRSFSTARKRQFPAPLNVDRISALFKRPGSILTLKRAWLGAALIAQRGKVKQRLKIPMRYVTRRVVEKVIKHDL